MFRTPSVQLKHQRAAVFAAALIGAAASILAMMSGCGPNDVIADNCPDAGKDDGGDDGGVGGSDSSCK